jgi:hypothetical protein
VSVADYASGSPPRFPDFDALSQSRHRDPVTTGVLLSRIGMASDIRFFTPAEQAIATALCDQLLHQHDGARLPIVNEIDARLAEAQTDGWRYDDMPEDAQAWRDSLGGLDADARDRFGCDFVTCSTQQQAKVIQGVQDAGTHEWHGMTAKHVWSLWTRYACTAFYAHPAAWNEIGFPGPAYPRGYKNPGVDAREPFEVRDTRPQDDPARRDG